MANETLNESIELASAPAANDYFWIWDTSVAQLKKIAPENAMGLFVTGGGVIATGGFTLTVPQSMTAAGRDVANTFTQLQTFSSGIAFAAETLSVYDEGTWTPTITGSSSNPTVTYTTQLGKYVRVGNLVAYSFQIVVNTYSGGSGNLQISAPFAAVGFSQGAGVLTRGVDFTGTPVTLIFAVQTASAIGQLITIADNAERTVEQVAAVAAGDTIQVTGLILL